MQYESYPKEKDTPSRKNRKSERNRVFQFNKALGPKLRRSERLARKKAALEAEEETVEE
jgi:hypothetical protein